MFAKLLSFSQEISTVSSGFRIFRTCSDPFGSVRTCWDAFGCIRMHLEAFGRFREIRNFWIFELGLDGFACNFTKHFFSRHKKRACARARARARAHVANLVVPKRRSTEITYARTDGRTDKRTDGRTDRQT